MSDPDPKPVTIETDSVDCYGRRVILTSPSGRTRALIRMLNDGSVFVQAERDGVMQYQLPIATPEREPANA